MRFGPVPTAEALGTILAHSCQCGGRKLAKGSVLTAGDIERLLADGMTELVVARLEPGDVDENAAAARMAAALVPNPESSGLRLTAAHTGRVNLNAAVPGVLDLDAERIHALNRLDPALTLAVLAPWTRVTPGMLAGTVKVISYAVPGRVLDRACELAKGAVRLRPVVMRSAGLILTSVDGTAGRLADKSVAAVQGRLSALGMELSEVAFVRHETAALAAALDRLGGDMALILTEAATSDLYDTAPEALRRAGGQVARFGMPVDPGNLLFYGRLAARPVIGLPGCARSPQLNGADWVLERLACGIDLRDDDIATMGVGGLLKEIPIRPLPRETRKVLPD
ncbi:MAG: molybdopterin-binding protein [Paracoccaceae bacterium]